MRFVLSLLNFRPGRIGGTENLLRRLLDELPAALGGDEVVVLCGRDAAATLETPGLERLVLEVSDRSLMARRAAEAFTPWRDREVEKAIDGLRPDAVYFPQNSMFPKGIAAPSAVMVGDMQHLALPRNFSVVDRAFRRAIYPYSLARARLVVSVSEASRRELVELAGVAPEKIRVVRPGHPPRREAAELPSPPVTGPYLYFPAASLRHKGHDELLRAFAYLVIARVPLRLVLTGQRTAYWRRIEALARSLGVAPRVLHLGYVAPDVVDSLYAHAAAVVFPSRFEGFGLPLIEAASMGARVIASRLPVFAEHDIEDVHFIDFRDPEQLRAALASPRRARLGPTAWSASDAAKATMAALRDTAAGSGLDGGAREPRETSA